jgi:hypothetical protein
MHVQTNSAGLRERFAQAAQDRHNAIAHQLQRAGAAHIVLSTEDDWLREIARFVSIRRSRGGGDVVATQHHRRVAQ